MNNFKICSTCKVQKPFSEFHRRRHYVTSGVRSACKACTARATAAAQREPPDPLKVLVRARTRRAIAAGILVPGRCARCGSANVQPHHPDYKRPSAHLHVVWLCPSDHALHHGHRPWTRQLELTLSEPPRL